MSHAVPEPRDPRESRETALPDPSREAAGSSGAGTAHRGQVLVIFAFLLTILLGMSAFVVDLAWIWSNQLQVQRAADAGALAGVVHLPTNPNAGIAAARSEARKNGYEHNVDAQIVANPDPSFNRRMIVTVSAPVDTFFMGLFGFDTVTVTRTARAEYILPVPMGSPQNYLGVGRLVQNVEGPTVADDWEVPHANGNPSSWDDDSYTLVNSNGNGSADDNGTNFAAWRDFEISIPEDAEIKGIQVEIQAQRSDGGTCRIGVELSAQADDNDDWTSTGFTVPASGGLTNDDVDYLVGSASELWGQTWTDDEVENNDFGIRLRRVSVSSCGRVEVDRIRIRIHYATSSDQVVAVRSPYSTALTPQNFWAGLQSQGSPSVQGDAHMTKYTDRDDGPVLNPNYCPWPGACVSNPEGLYNYAIELPAGGEIWLYDPGFCDGTGTRGTGEYWSIDDDNELGAPTPQPVSAFYRLYNTNNTAWDYTDDTRADSQAGTAVPGDPTDIQPNSFRRGVNNNGVRYYDASLRSAPSGGSYSDCDGATWHHNWWRLAAGLAPGTYRLHTTSHDRVLPNDQNNTTALNSFGIWASAGGTNVNNVRVYGLGAMEAYFPLPENSTSQFYLAQLEAVHANKWVDISLWDPGDARVVADLSILIPTSSGYQRVPFYTHSNSGTTLPTDFSCGPDDNDGGSQPRTTVRTSNGGDTGNYNGEWLRLCFQLPSNYSAPTPPVDALTPTGCVCNGWFRIEYRMGNGDGSSTDLTTWKVEVRGNPVHLITPGDDVPTP
jgi:hypothetical protein